MLKILERLVALNAERAKEEASGLVRWLRPDYQNPEGAQAHQAALRHPHPHPSAFNPQPPSQVTLAQDVVRTSQGGERGVGGCKAARDRRPKVAKAFARVKRRRGRDIWKPMHGGPRPPGQGRGDIPSLTTPHCLNPTPNILTDAMLPGALQTMHEQDCYSGEKPSRVATEAEGDLRCDANAQRSKRDLHN